VGRKSDRSVSAVLGAVVNVRVRAAVAAILLVLAAVAPSYAATQTPVRLVSNGASPSTGTTSTTFTISVTYKNFLRIPAASVTANVAGSSKSMSQDVNSGTDWRNGVVFSVSTKLPAGTWVVSFDATDDQGHAGSVAGPTITVESPAPTPTPKPTPTPTPKPTPTPTPKPTPTPTPAPTPTPKPTPTPTATPAPTPSPKTTPRPTATPKPTAAPTATPKPTGGATNPPTTAPTANPTNAPTAAPTAAPTSAPTAAPSASDGSGGTPFASASPSASDAAPSPSAIGQVAVVVPPVGNGGAPGASGAPTGNGGNGGSGNSTVDTPAGSSGGSGSGDLASLGNASAAAAVLSRLMPMLVVTTGGVAMAMAFLAFGRRRRDESPTASDAALAAAAASGMPLAAAPRWSPAPPPAPRAVAPAAVADAPAVDAVRASMTPVVTGPVDTNIPRWRRQSLIEARKADPTRSVHTSVNLTFSERANAAISGMERRRIRYRLVSLLDQPDDVRGVEIGSLDEGDEVVLLERLGTYWRVLCPDGREGWVHKMVLGAAVVDEVDENAIIPTLPAPMGVMAPPPSALTPAALTPPAAPGPSWTSGDEGPAPGSFEDVLRLYSERRNQQQLGDA
jgi:hypothetical protein